MFFPKVFSFAILLATAAADLHDSCTCINGNSYSGCFTKAACSSYDAAGWKWGSTKYDGVSGRCAGVSGGKLAGDQWEAACKTIAQHVTVPCPNGKGKCYANVDEVRGSC